MQKNYLRTPIINPKNNGSKAYLPITFEVGLDENKVPESISWTAEDGGVTDAPLSNDDFCVGSPFDTLRMDLWTKDMPVDEMKQFFHQTLVSMANTFERATDDQKSATMRDFCDYFAEKLELKK